MNDRSQHDRSAFHNTILFETCQTWLDTMPSLQKLLQYVALYDSEWQQYS